MKKQKTLIALITIILLFFSSCKSEEKSNLNTNNEEIIRIVKQWNLAHNERDYSIFKHLYSQNKIDFYKKKFSNEECIKNKQKLFQKYQDFYQQINGKIEIISLDPDKFKTTFIKQVTISGKTTDYPSYLIIGKSNNKLSIITEGDYVTDKNLKNKTFRKSEKKNKKTESFISGLNNPKIFSSKEVSNGVKYKLNYTNEPTKPVELTIKRKNNKLKLSINYGENINTVLPFEFYSTFVGSMTTRELRTEKKDDQYMIGQHDFDNNGIDEIVVALKSNFNTTDYYRVHFYVYKYLPPKNGKHNYSFENWKSFGDFETWEVAGGTKVIIENNKISTKVSSYNDSFEEWIFENGEFIRNGQI